MYFSSGHGLLLQLVFPGTCRLDTVDIVRECASPRGTVIRELNRRLNSNMGNQTHELYADSPPSQSMVVLVLHL